LLLIGLELLFLSANLGFIMASIVLDDIVGYIFSMFIFAMAGVEVALGLALTIVIYRQYGNIYSENLTKLKT
jgi:NADH-quinone oxidoreductase subunit K